MLKKEDRREPGGLAGIQKTMFRDKRYEVTLNHEGKQVEKAEKVSNEKQSQTIQMPSEYWLVVPTTFLASFKLC